MSNYKFETLQLHVGQEQADPATDARAVPSTRPHPMSSTTASTRQTASASPTPATSMGD